MNKLKLNALSYHINTELNLFNSNDSNILFKYFLTANKVLISCENFTLKYPNKARTLKPQ